jgi:hypothetical protein
VAIVAESFLGRWAQRKANVRQGRELAEPTRPPEDKPLHAPAQGDGQPLAPPLPVPAADPSTPAQMEGGEPPLTLQDAQALGMESDYTPFLARRVDPAVRNAAMKKLFSNPHFNVMDGLDTYIDDYAKPDPLPLAMLRKMASAQFLNLLEEDQNEPASQPIPRQDHANIDLQLQPNDAPEGGGPGRGTE